MLMTTSMVWVQQKNRRRKEYKKKRIEVEKNRIDSEMNRCRKGG